MQIRGTIGRITWAYYTAAALHGYTVQYDKATKTWTLTGTVVTSDPFKLSQSPLEFVAPHKGGGWKWQVLSHSITQGTVHATLAPLKESAS